MIGVDDLECVDEASIAWLAALAHKTERYPLLIVISAIDDASFALPASLQLVSDASNTIELSDLSAPQTEALIRSLFGDIRNVAMCASMIHGLCHGNPRAAMELAQHLVDAGHARYQRGSWVLPDSLDESDLPSSMAASLAARLTGLSGAARELADALALSTDDSIPIDQYGRLLGTSDHKLVFGALDELVARRIVHTDGEHAFFVQRGMIAVLDEHVPAERRRVLHTRIAGLLDAVGGDVYRRLHHLFAAGIDGEALDVISRLDLTPELAPVPVLKTAVERAEAAGVRAKLLQSLRMSLLVAAPYAMDQRSVRSVAPIVLAQLEQDSGLVRFRELHALPASERLAQAIGQTQAAYLERPEHQRVYTVFEAVRELARISGALSSMALPIFDHELYEALPSLDPLLQLSPGLVVVTQFVEAGKHWISGRIHRSAAIYRTLLDRIEDPDGGGLDEPQRDRLRMGLQYLLGLFEALYGIEAVENRARLLERSRDWRVNAWRLRSLFQLAIGNAAEANRCFRRSELLQAQDGLKERFVNATTGMAVVLQSRLGDLLGIKAQLPTLSRLGSQFREWKAVDLMGRSRYSELQGDHQTALALALEGLALVRPGRHPFFSPLAASHIRILSALGRVPEACDIAREYVRVSAEHDLGAADLPQYAARALMQAGELDEALHVLQPVLDEAEQLRRVGLAAASLYQVRARIAIAAQDRDAFREYAERCATDYARSQNPALGAELTALFDDARQRGLLPSDRATHMSQSLQPSAPESEYETLHSRFAECVDLADRARCALTLLLQHTVSARGYLYTTADGQTAALIAALPDPPCDNGVMPWMERCVAVWREQARALADDRETRSETAEATGEITEDTEEATETGELTGTADATADTSNAFQYTDSDGRELEAVALEYVSTAGVRALAAILVVENVPGQRAYIRSSVTSSIATELVEHGDSTGWQP